MRRRMLTETVVTVKAANKVAVKGNDENETW